MVSNPPDSGVMCFLWGGRENVGQAKLGRSWQNRKWIGPRRVVGTAVELPPDSVPPPAPQIPTWVSLVMHQQLS